jgi:membrane-associated progesterone receptor component
MSAQSRRWGHLLLSIGGIGLLVALLPWPDILAHSPAWMQSAAKGCPYLDTKEKNGTRDFSLAAETVKRAHASLFHASLPSEPQKPSDIVMRSYTEDELERYDGTDKTLPILLAVGGYVFDVENGRAFYGTGGPYQKFAGQACTRGVTLPSLEDEDVSDEDSDFTAEQLQKKEEWIQFFLDKYANVGTLVSDTADQRRARVEKRQAAKEKERLAKEEKLQTSLGKVGKEFSLQDLAKYDGSNTDLSIYFALAGHVLDVTESKKFYGPGSPRGMYAGRACTRALVLQSIKEEDINDNTSDFTAAQQKTLDQRVSFFLGKFPKVGVLKSAAAGGGGL